MTLPVFSNLKSPILQELFVVGGSDDVRFLYLRLISYFPSLSDAEIAGIRNAENQGWRKTVQKAGKFLEAEKLITRQRGFWSLTPSGKSAVEADLSGVITENRPSVAFSHQTIQLLLVEIGAMLGYFAAREFEFYDVIWRINQNHPRISHVFEVQSKGNIDSAFAKLKRAFDAQRSKPFLVVAGEHDINRARTSLRREFRELENALTIISFAELTKIHKNLHEISKFIPDLLQN